MFGYALCIEVVPVDWPAELKRLGRIQCNDPIVRSAAVQPCRLRTSLAACSIQLLDRLRLPGLIFVDNALPGRLAFAILSLLVRASALKALM